MFKVFLSIFLFLSTNAFAKQYFSADTISPILLTKPLLRDGDEYKNEVKKMIAIQKDKANHDEIEKARKEEVLKIDTTVLAISHKINRADFPNMYKMFDNIFETTKPIVENAKSYWNSKRPYLSEKDIKILVASPRNPSYPSGHTCLSYVVAKILGKALPNKAATFEEKAEKFAWRRVIVGAHYPNDIRGGKELAFLIVGSLMQNEDFLRDFDLAKKELEEKY